jgi:hypothetical protein
MIFLDLSSFIGRFPYFFIPDFCDAFDVRPGERIKRTIDSYQQADRD